MELVLQGHSYQYAVEQIMLVLFPQERPTYPGVYDPASGNACRSTLTMGGGDSVVETEISRGGMVVRGVASAPAPSRENILVYDRVLQRLIKQSFYKAAVQLLPKKPDWGALTGIRPAKLASRALEEGLSEEETARRFREEYFVSPLRTQLAIESAQAGLAVKRSLGPEELSLYIGIPFCPTRCAYCSFVSADVKRTLKLVEPFLDALEQEIDAAAALLQRSGSVISTIYIGGGTPTTLSAQQLDRLLSHVCSAFDLSRLREFTVEAGRPDTITAEKMQVLHRHGVDRVSVNPQTMHDHVLKAMGRDHRAADIRPAYEAVRAAGLGGVNMDLIAGLPEDSVEGFRSTLEQVLSLDPENITVHTLALKKGSKLMMEHGGLPTGAEVERMLDFAWTALRQAGYRPYYLYRQKYMSGALENIGWCKPGFEGVYNICIMEELHTILALGAGGSTKLTDPETGKIVRITNPKYPYEYIERIDRICHEKEALVPFQQALIRRAGQGKED